MRLNLHFLRVPNLKSMTSAEPKRTSAYSQDIALRVVWMRLGMDLLGTSQRDYKLVLEVLIASTNAMYALEASLHTNVLTGHSVGSWMNTMSY